MLMSSIPVHLNETNFDQTIKKNKLVLIDFWAAWCGPCRALAPAIEDLATELAGKVLVAKIDVDESPRIAEKFEVFSIPTVILIREGSEVDRIVGLCPKKQYVTAIEKQIT